MIYPSVIFCPTVRLRSAGYGKEKFHIRMVFPENDSLKGRNCIKAQGASAVKLPVSIVIRICNALKNTFLNRSGFICVQYPVSCEESSLP